jgi:hypothetical protein
MKSAKQRRAELDARKKARAGKLSADRATAARAAMEREAARGAPVNREALTPHNSYDEPEFVKRGFYSDQPFDCKGCGKSEIWTAAQQKWWYEVAKGEVFTIANRCRTCRRRERERRAARQVHAVGARPLGRENEANRTL